jgi:NAD(P)-dependent dehydrogenase (short-subunit alcohol dehydrogenase family)
VNGGENALLSKNRHREISLWRLLAPGRLAVTDRARETAIPDVGENRGRFDSAASGCAASKSRRVLLLARARMTGWRYDPMRRGGEPEEVARAILWLLSEEASYITGTIVDVSGGR